jgi:hypothetical protein
MEFIGGAFVMAFSIQIIQWYDKKVQILPWVMFITAIIGHRIFTWFVGG